MDPLGQAGAWVTVKIADSEAVFSYYTP